MTRALAIGLWLVLAATAGAQQPPPQAEVPAEPAEEPAAPPAAEAVPDICRPPAGSDEAELWYAMDQQERLLRQSPLLVRDPALNAYVGDVVCRVAGDLCPAIRVYLVAVPYFNASMAPNGMMVIWTGALLRLQDEAELALVIAHEVGHFRARHSLEQWRRIKRTTAFLSVFGVMTAGIPFAGLTSSLIGYSSLMKFSRDKEREADQMAIARLRELGYDLRAGADVWARLKREEDARRYDRPIPVFASHPQTTERLEDMQVVAAEHQGEPGSRQRPAYLAATAPFLEEWLEQELSRRMYDTSVRVIGDLRELAPPERAGLYAFFLAEAHRRRNRDDDGARALALYAEATAAQDAPAAAFREIGLARRSSGERAAALAALRRYLELSPEAGDRAFVQRYIEELEAIP